MKGSHVLLGTVLFGVLVLVYLTTSAYYKKHESVPTHNLTSGCRLFFDELLFNDTIIQEKSKNLARASKDIRYPPVTEPMDCSITYIEVKDKGKGGYVNIKSGGAGDGYVKFHLESQDGKGFEFQISIYGYNYN